MAKEESERCQFYVKRINEMLKQVPKSVREGSYQRSVSFKAAADKAGKALRTPNSLARLSAAHNELAAFY